MIGSIETLGLRVEWSTPSSYSTEVDINSTITVGFNSELNTDSINENFFVLEDVDRKYIQGDGIDLKNYKIVKGMLTYKDKSIIFKPSGQLATRARYIITVRSKTLTDFLGRTMLTDYVSTFDTEGVGTLKPCGIVEPINNSNLTSLTNIVLEDLESDKYIYQISKQKTFEICIVDKIVDSPDVLFDLKLEDGLYYIRAKAMNGHFGDVSSFSITEISGSIPVEDDFNEDLIYEELIPINEISIEESFPTGSQVATGVNVLYKKFNGKVTEDMIDFDDSQVYGELSDEEDEIKEHGILDGSFMIAYDDESDISYVFFIPVPV